MVRITNSRLPVYKATSGDGLGNIIQGLFARISPKITPIVKQLSMKAISDVIDKATSTIGNIAGNAFSAATDRLARSIRQTKTEIMPANVSEIINQDANHKLAALMN